jgi:hypothetical protein
MRLITFAMLVAVIAALQMWVPATAQRSLRCLHEGSENPQDRQRRLDAIELARAINRAQWPMRPSRPRMYRPLQQLQGLPETPEGFRIQFHTDGTSYLFSLKDTMDRCQFSIFSDQDGDIYEASTRPDVRVIPVDSQ